jgi:hypothetical protein
VRCSLVEGDTNLATSVTVSAGGTVPPMEQLALTEALDWQVGQLSVRKVVVGRRSTAQFGFHVACAVPTKIGPVAVPLAEGAADFRLTAGATTSVTALTAAVCAVVESDPGGAASVSYALAGGVVAPTAPGIGVLLADGASGTVTVTNSFAPRVCCLPDTGGSVRPVVTVALAVLAGGLALVLIGRRGRRRPTTP